MDCPDEQAIAQFVGGALTGDARAEIERHLDACSSCAGVVAAFVQLYDGPPPIETDPPHASVTIGDAAPGVSRTLRPGASVGRYRVLEIVGVGGMGVVYAAYDPELDRRIALKLLRGTGPTSDERRVRLVREAQAMARLAHPNVITVHDVGTHGDDVFVAMEFVQGRTLSAWLSSDRPWSEIARVFAAAGRGLQAAHAAGIVHRDFKPDNVLVGDDGRVRVTDFGLARIGEAEGATISIPVDLASTGGTDTLTVTGAVLGTPAYMAPEQFEAGEITAASDQYAYCVALYEAAWGKRPHEGRSLPELANRVLDGTPPRPTTEGKAPPHVRSAILRGLSRQPSDRFASMTELLAVLERRPRSSWRTAGLFAVPLLAVGAAWLSTSGDRAPAAISCTREGLHGVWDDAARARLRERFLATELPYAEATWTRVEGELDAYTTRWLELDQAACEARAIDAGDAVAALQRLCLQAPHDAITATVEVLGEADAAIVDKAGHLVAGLPTLDGCDDPDALTGRQVPPPPAEEREAVAAARAAIARVHALMGAARYDDAVELAERTLEDTRALSYVPVRAEATYFLSTALSGRGDHDEAAGLAHEATKLATASSHHEYSARLWLSRSSTLIGDDRYDEALRAVEIGQAELLAWGQEKGLGVALDTQVGDIHVRAGRYDEALAVYREVEPELKARGDETRRADVLSQMGLCELERRNIDASLAHYEESLKVRTEVLGPDHPEVGNAYLGIALVFLARGDISRARGYLESAEGIMRRALGDEHSSFITVSAQLANVLSFQGEHDAAIERLQHAIAVEVGDRPITDARTAIAMAALAQAELNANRFDDAVRDAKRAVEGLERLFPEGHLREVPPRMFYAMGLLETGEPEAALVQADRGIEVCRRLCPEHDVNFVSLLEAKARVLVRLGRKADAAAVLTEGMEVAEPLGSLWSGWIGFRWAEIVWDDPKQRTRALELAREGQRLLAEAGDARVKYIDRWLSAHDPA
jgi:tetratricopeptide (TPR) repeat protein/predicted Ser/Thr protein kinase